MLGILRLMTVDARTHNPILTHFAVCISPAPFASTLADDPLNFNFVHCLL